MASPSEFLAVHTYVPALSGVMLEMTNMPSELKLTVVPDGVAMVIVAAALLSTEQFKIASSPSANVRVVISLLNCGASKYVGNDWR